QAQSDADRSDATHDAPRLRLNRDLLRGRHDSGSLRACPEESLSSFPGAGFSLDTPLTTGLDSARSLSMVQLLGNRQTIFVRFGSSVREDSTCQPQSTAPPCKATRRSNRGGTITSN